MQVGCTINYARKVLWKKWKKFVALTISARSARIIEVLSPKFVVSPSSGPVAQLGARFHGMEEVVGSIPTRSTNSLSNSQIKSPYFFIPHIESQLLISACMLLLGALGGNVHRNTSS